uniref:Uncharacterized protein n=1 Tax=Rhizophora mucronata TaxID=61149 RepID=A0A2P2MW77_RHIMU
MVSTEIGRYTSFTFPSLPPVFMCTVGSKLTCCKWSLQGDKNIIILYIFKRFEV